MISGVSGVPTWLSPDFELTNTSSGEQPGGFTPCHQPLPPPPPSRDDGVNRLTGGMTDTCDSQFGEIGVNNARYLRVWTKKTLQHSELFAEMIFFCFFFYFFLYVVIRKLTIRPSSSKPSWATRRKSYYRCR